MSFFAPKRHGLFLCLIKLRGPMSANETHKEDLRSYRRHFNQWRYPVSLNCHICISENRDPSKICVTESPADVYTIDSSTNYSGYYFVLDGNLSPLDGRGPEEIGIKRLEARLEQGNINELILATSTTIEGEATSHYVQQLSNKYDIKISRIAFGIPLNGELGYLDSDTISHAFNERKEL